MAHVVNPVCTCMRPVRNTPTLAALNSVVLAMLNKRVDVLMLICQVGMKAGPCFNVKSDFLCIMILTIRIIGSPICLILMVGIPIIVRHLPCTERMPNGWRHSQTYNSKTPSLY